jgi:hypothetical protein
MAKNSAKHKIKKSNKKLSKSLKNNINIDDLIYKEEVILSKSSKKQVPPTNLKKLPNAWVFSRRALILLWHNRGLFLGIAVVYGLVSLVLVQSLGSPSTIVSLKNKFNNTQSSSVATAVSIFGALIGSSNSSSSGGAYQLPIYIMASLAIIWALRQVLNGNKIRIRDAYYKGMYPLIPFILVVLFIALELLPFLIGAFLYTIVIENSIAVGFIEHLLALLIFLVLTVWSLYLICASVFALYIVTLPDITPMQAIRSANNLIKNRRLSIFRKLAFLPLIILLALVIIMLPVIIWLTTVANWIFFILSALILLYIHSYIYNIYRELIDE